MRIPGLLLLCGCLLACRGDDDGPGTGPVDPADAEAGCRSDCEHRIACGSTLALAECTQDCVDDLASGWFRADVFDALIECFAAQACTADREECFDACAPTAAHERYETACRAIFGPCATPDEVTGLCETSPDPAASGDVGFLCFAIPAIMDELTACMAPGTACQAALDCVEAVAEVRGIDL